MSELFNDGPIIACSTGDDAPSAIAVLRISGISSLQQIQPLIKKKLGSIGPRIAYLTEIIEDSKTLDEVLLTYYPGPKSYTGEEMVEISTHGNPLNIQRILRGFYRLGLRAAGPGEFTYRALKNNKMTLSQVEGLDLILNSSSYFGLDQGLGALNGELFKKYQDLRSIFIRLKSSIELLIDFSEDVGEEQGWEIFQNSFLELTRLVENLKQRSTGNISDLSSPSIALFGKTNAGKSTLFNKLLRDERSIVSSEEGTTRDYVSEVISLGETNFRIVDTAGVRSSENEIESEGIKRSLAWIDKAFYKILVINPFDFKEKNFDDFKNYSFDLIVFTHADKKDFIKSFQKISDLPETGRILIAGADAPIGPKGTIGPIGPDFKNGPIEPELLIGPMGPVIKNGPIEPDQIYYGWDSIENLTIRKYTELTSKNPIIIERHRHLIAQIHDDITKFQVVMDETRDIAILSSEINIIETRIFELVGIVKPDDILTSIFSNFCIGK